MGKAVGTCGDRDGGERYVWLTGGIEGTSWLSLQLDFDLVCKLPQIGYGLAQIGILSMDSAGVCGGCEGDHHTELLECRFHGFSFDKMTLVTAPAGGGIIPPSFLLYSRRVMVLLGRGSGLLLFFIGEGAGTHIVYWLAGCLACCWSSSRSRCLRLRDSSLVVSRLCGTLVLVWIRGFASECWGSGSGTSRPPSPTF